MKLRDIISDIKSGDWGKDSLSDNYTEAVYCIRGADIPNINNGEKRILPSRFIKEKAAKTKALSSNNLVVEISGGSPTQSTGRIAFISNELLSHYDKRIICSNFCKVIIPKNINPEYLYYYWKDLYNKGILFSYENGTTGIKNLDLNSFINEQDIWVPDPNTQQKIVQILKSLDDKIELNRRINANLEAQAQALFRSWFVDFEPFRDGPFVDSELGKIPQGWKVGNYTDIVEIKGGGTPKTGIQEYWDGTIPFFSPKDVGASCFVLDTEKHITAKGLENCNSSLFQTNTVFITARGTVGKVVMTGTEMAMNQTNYALLGKQNISQYYVYHITRQLVTRLLKKANGAVFNAITTRDFTSEQIVMPPFSTIRQFSDVVKPIYENILLNDVQSNRLSALRDTLLPQLMAGEIAIE